MFDSVDFVEQSRRPKYVCHMLSHFATNLSQSSKTCQVHGAACHMAIWPDREVPNVGSCRSSTSEVQAKGLKVEQSNEAKLFWGIVGC